MSLEALKNDDKPTVVKKMRDYSKEPVFTEKNEKASAFVKKHGLPKSVTKKKQ